MGGRGPFVLQGTGGIGRTVLQRGDHDGAVRAPFPDHCKECGSSPHPVTTRPPAPVGYPANVSEAENGYLVNA